MAAIKNGSYSYSMDNLTIFDLMYEDYKIKNKIRLIELFGGVGSQAMALRDLGADFEHYRLAEFDKYAVASYNAIHGTNFTPSDIREVKGVDLGITNTNQYDYITTYSFPCLTSDTLVMAQNGYKKIQDIQTGDMVLTHKNTYKKVLKKVNQGEKSIYSIKGMGVDVIRCTGNHKFWVREKKRKFPTYENGKRGSIRYFEEPKWIETKDLSKRYYMGVAINQNESIPNWKGCTFKWSDGRKDRYSNKLGKYMDNHSFWWLIGRYIGDGWIRTNGGIVIACNKKEIGEMPTHLRNLNLHYNLGIETTSAKIHIPTKELSEFVLQFGKGARNKHLTQTIFDLPRELLKSFVDGYVSADGCISKEGLYRISTISRGLAYGIAQCVAKAYQTPYRMHKHVPAGKCVIEGRTVNQQPSYTVAWKTEKRKQDKAFYENGYVWFPISEVEEINKTEIVWDIEVETEHSFTANGVITHNCQDLSPAGKGRGMTKGTGTRSGLLWEVERLLNEVEELPQVLLMENVPEVKSAANIEDFHAWQDFLISKGYTNYVDVLNAKDFGVAQNRNRCFMVSILGEYNYKFPQPTPLTKTVNDYLEDEVDEKYYINSEKAQSLIKDLEERGELKGSVGNINPSGNGINGTVYGTDGAAPTLTTNKGEGIKIAIDGTINNPHRKELANCVTARTDRGISNQSSVGTMVVEQRADEGLRTFKDGLCGTIRSEKESGGDKRVIVASRGRNKDNPSDRTAGNEVEQRLEVKTDGTANTLTTVAKDNMVLGVEEHRYRLRKLTPLECWRLMNFTDGDFYKAAAVVSNSQLYEQAGNSIVKAVLMAIFKQML